ncbi:MAG: hypothetical protein AAGF83_04115 [Cyanobacteria bacterium P01_G01_bin.67]
MKIDAIALAKKIQTQLQIYQQHQQFSQIAQLITFALQVLPSDYNRKIFGDIPTLFREVEIKDYEQFQQQDMYFEEPIIYKIYYPNQQQLYDIPYFYVFCYLKDQSHQLSVYFQSAHPNYQSLTQNEYSLATKKIKFEGSISAFKLKNISVISISDPGHFIPGLTSSFYAGSAEINFNQIIANFLDKFCSFASIKLKDTMLFGSSAGTFGALLSSTYLQNKANVLAVNSQINLHYRKHLMKTLFEIDHPQNLLIKFGNQISCSYRFKQELNSIPNIYLLANINDKLHQRNFDFYQLYLSRFVSKGTNNQSVFDSYYGVEGHGRPESNSLKRKIEIAREVLTMKATWE